jgi:hypothetical protein
MEYTETEFEAIYTEHKLKLLKHTYVFVKDHHRAEERAERACRGAMRRCWAVA